MTCSKKISTFQLITSGPLYFCVTEINGSQEAVGSDEKLPIKMTEVSDNNNTESENKEISDSEESDHPERY